MGQKQTKKNNDCVHKKDKGKKKEETTAPSPTSTTVVLKVDMHCDGCASKIVKCVRSFEGVENLKTENEAGKLTITGNVDPAKLRDKLAHKMKKNVQLISPISKNKDKENKPKNDDKKPKESPVTTMVLKVPLCCPCQGYEDKIRKIVLRIKGVQDVGVDRGKGMVTVKGTMDTKALVEKLSEKCKRKVEVVPPKKEKEKKEKEGEKVGDKGGNNNDFTKKKKKGGVDGDGDGDGDGGGGDGDGGGGGDRGNNDKGDKGGSNGQRKTEHNIVDYMVPSYGYCYSGCGNGNYMGYYYPASQMFSDENPYACCIM